MSGDERSERRKKKKSGVVRGGEVGRWFKIFIYMGSAEKVKKNENESLGKENFSHPHQPGLVALM